MATTDQRKLPESGMEVDRLSSLPDEVLTHILSFLQTKYAVGTAVLSRRWTNLWTRVSNLDLDNRLLYQPRRCAERDMEFCRFVDRVLSQHSNLNSLRRFRLSFSEGYSEPSPNSWRKMELEPASQLEEIDVSLLFPKRDLPESFYTLKNLKVLKLASVIITTASVFLPSVKTLQLSLVEVLDYESFSRFISGCPVLETAHLEQCYCSSNRNGESQVTASLPFLKNLTFIGNLTMMLPIVIEAPSLELLELRNFKELEIVGNRPLSCIQLVKLHVGGLFGSSHLSLSVLLTHVSNAQQMWLSWQTLILLSFVGKLGRLPAFPKLIHLTIEFSGSSNALHCLLNSASKLQTLVIHLGVQRMRWEKSEPVCTPECLLSSLQQIEIHGLAAVSDDLRLVRYLLKAGAVLKTVNLNVNLGFNVEYQCKRIASLLKLPRASNSCEVRLFHDGVEMYLDTDDAIDISDEEEDDEEEDEDEDDYIDDDIIDHDISDYDE